MTRDLRALLRSMTQSSTFFALTGPSALSAFRAARLLASIRSVEKSADSLSGRFVHFVHAERPLDASERARLDALLDYGDAADTAAKGAAFLVVPRLGTISPWASKATDIAHNTGLTAVQRIERGTLYIDRAGPQNAECRLCSACGTPLCTIE